MLREIDTGIWATEAPHSRTEDIIERGAKSVLQGRLLISVDCVAGHYPPRNPTWEQQHG
jgi:hypothetical protein